MERYVRFVAHNPTVMWDRWNVEEIASAQWNDPAIFKCSCRLASKDEADMFDWTTR